MDYCLQSFRHKTFFMKKILLGTLFMTMITGASFAQIGSPHKGKTKTHTTVTKVKPKSTVSQKIHNSVHHDKEYSGVKVKEKATKK